MHSEEPVRRDQAVEEILRRSTVRPRQAQTTIAYGQHVIENSDAVTTPDRLRETSVSADGMPRLVLPATRRRPATNTLRLHRSSDGKCTLTHIDECKVYRNYQYAKWRGRARLRKAGGGLLLTTDAVGMVQSKERIKGPARNNTTHDKTSREPRPKRWKPWGEPAVLLTSCGLFALLQGTVLRIGYFSQFNVGLDQVGLLGYQLLIPSAVAILMFAWLVALVSLAIQAGRSKAYGLHFAILTWAACVIIAFLARWLRQVDVFPSGWILNTLTTAATLSLPLALLSYITNDAVLEFRSQVIGERRLFLVALSMEFALLWLLFPLQISPWVAGFGGGVAIIATILARRFVRRGIDGKVLPMHRQSLVSLIFLGLAFVSVSSSMTWFLQSSMRASSSILDSRVFLFIATMILAMTAIDAFSAARSWIAGLRHVAWPVLVPLIIAILAALSFGTASFGMQVAREAQSLQATHHGYEEEGRLGFAEIYLGLSTQWVCVHELPGSGNGLLTRSPVQLLPTTGSAYITWDALLGTRRWPLDGLVVQEAPKPGMCSRSVG